MNIQAVIIHSIVLKDKVDKVRCVVDPQNWTLPLGVE